MAALVAKLSAQDSKDLEKYLRYLVYKTVQVIVQSRIGDRQSIPSKQFASGADWFNLTIRDDPEVLAEVKQIYPGAGGGLAGGDIVCVETLLRTQSGDAVSLETWWLKMSPPCDLTARVSFTVYSRIGSLLKSVFIASRTVPAYRLSRHYAVVDNLCSIYYRVYVGQPTFQLGSSFATRTVALVPTPTGTVQLLLAYRTQLIAGSRPPSSAILELCDDHFQVGTSSTSVSSPVHIASRWHSLSKFQQPDVVISKSQISSSPPDHNRMVSIPSGLSRLEEDPIVPLLAGAVDDRRKLAAFGGVTTVADNTVTDSDVPFSQLLDLRDSSKRLSSCSSEMERSAAGSEPMVLATSSSSASDREIARGGGDSSRTVPSEDFVVVELKTAFGSVRDGCAATSVLRENAAERDEGDLGQFYRECQTAPVLSMFQHSTTDVHQLINSITDQLALFESNAKDFDDFVNSFPET